MKFLKTYEGVSDWKADVINQIVNNDRYYTSSVSEIEDYFLYFIEGNNLIFNINHNICDEYGNIPTKKAETSNKPIHPCYEVILNYDFKISNTSPVDEYVKKSYIGLDIIQQINKCINTKLIINYNIKKLEFLSGYYGSQKISFKFIIIMEETINNLIPYKGGIIPKSKLPTSDNLRSRIIDLNIFNILSFNDKNGTTTIRVEIKKEFEKIKTRPTSILNNVLPKTFPGIQIVPVIPNNYRVIDIIYKKI